MPTDVQKRANAKWRESQEQISFRVPKEEKSAIDTHCTMTGERLAVFVRRAIHNQIAADNAQAKEKAPGQDPEA